MIPYVISNHSGTRFIASAQPTVFFMDVPFRTDTADRFPTKY